MIAPHAAVPDVDHLRASGGTGDSPMIRARQRSPGSGFRARMGHAVLRQTGSGYGRWRNRPIALVALRQVRLPCRRSGGGAPHQDSNLRTRLRRALLCWPLTCQNMLGRVRSGAYRPQFVSSGHVDQFKESCQSRLPGHLAPNQHGMRPCPSVWRIGAGQRQYADVDCSI